MSTSNDPDAAAKSAPQNDDTEIPLFCGVPPHPEPELPPDLEPERAAAIVMLKNKWANGTVLHYYFFEGPTSTQQQRDVVRKAFERWKSLGIGLEFKETRDRAESELRIKFSPGGSWSYVGNYNTQIALDKETMNFGWSLSDGWGWATALHEIGHAIGMPHEHQNPQSGIVWDEEKVIADYMQSQKWPREKVVYNIIRKIDQSEVAGTTWDPHSIMHYPFKPGLIKAPSPYDVKGTPRNTDLSPGDIALVQSLYPGSPPAPKKLSPLNLVKLALRSGQQADFEIEPEISGKYKLATVGRSDSKMVLFEERDGEPRYVSADDDSAEDRNATLEVRLTKGRRYFLRVRLHHLMNDSGFGVMMT